MKSGHACVSGKASAEMRAGAPKVIWAAAVFAPAASFLSAACFSGDGSALNRALFYAFIAIFWSAVSAAAAFETGLPRGAKAAWFAANLLLPFAAPAVFAWRFARGRGAAFKGFPRDGGLFRPLVFAAAFLPAAYLGFACFMEAWHAESKFIGFVPFVECMFIADLVCSFVLLSDWSFLRLGRISALALGLAILPIVHIFVLFFAAFLLGGFCGENVWLLIYLIYIAAFPLYWFLFCRTRGVSRRFHSETQTHAVSPAVCLLIICSPLILISCFSVLWCFILPFV